MKKSIIITSIVIVAIMAGISSVLTQNDNSDEIIRVEQSIGNYEKIKVTTTPML